VLALTFNWLCAQHLVYRGLVVRNPVRVKRPASKSAMVTSALHLPRFAPATRLKPWQRFYVRFPWPPGLSRLTTSNTQCSV